MKNRCEKTFKVLFIICINLLQNFFRIHFIHLGNINIINVNERMSVKLTVR